MRDDDGREGVRLRGEERKAQQLDAQPQPGR